MDPCRYVLAPPVYADLGEGPVQIRPVLLCGRPAGPDGLCPEHSALLTAARARLKAALAAPAGPAAALPPEMFQRKRGLS